MLSIGIGEIQKNTSIFAHLTQAVEIVDKRKKQLLAIVYPAQQHSVIDSLAGKYRNRIPKTTLSMDEIKEKAMQAAMEEKYGLST